MPTLLHGTAIKSAARFALRELMVWLLVVFAKHKYEDACFNCAIEPFNNQRKPWTASVVEELTQSTK